jgi:Ran GTPase-activating protein (RanGAP) involved in mRNA processing and transport
MQYQIGDKVMFLDGNDQREGMIEDMDYNDNSVQIAGSDNTLYLTSMDKILYSLEIKPL